MTLRSARISAVTLGISCLLLGAAITRSQGTPGSAERLRRADHLLPTFDVEGVNRLTIRRPGTREPALILERDARDPESFRLGGKEGKRADAGLVTALLRALDQEKVQRRYDAPPAENASVLATPDFELTIEGRDRAVHLLVARGHNYLIAKVIEGGSEPEYVALGLGLENQLGQTERDLTTRSLFPIAKSETREILLNGGDSKVLLKPSAFGFSLGGNGARADRDLVDALFFQLARSELVLVRERGVVEAGQAGVKNLVTIEQRGKNGGDAQVRFGGPCESDAQDDGRILALELGGEERAGCVDGAIVAALTIEPERYLDRRILPLRTDEIDHVVFEAPRGAIDLIRKDDAFEVTDAEGRHAVDKDRGTRLLRALSDAQGTPRDSAPTQTGAGVLRVVGHGPGDLVIDERVPFWNDEGQFFVKRGDGVILALSELQAAPFEEASLWLRDRKILRGDPASILALDLAEGLTLRRLERTPEGFRFAREGALADAHLVDEFLGVLLNLEAKTFLDDLPSAVTPTFSVGFARSVGSGVLAVYERRLGGFRATLTGISYAFLLDPLVVAKLQRSLESRAPASFNLEQATRVVLTATSLSGTRTLELVRRNGALTALLDQEVPLSSEIAALLEAIGPLWARPEVSQPAPARAFLSLRIESEEQAEPLLLTFYKVPGISLTNGGEIVAFNSRSSLGFAFDERAIERLLSSF